MDTSKLFDQFNSEDSLAILLFMLIAFLFGLLVGYLLRSRRVMALKKELKAKKKELSDAQEEIAQLQETLALKEADLKKAGFAVQEAEARADRMEEEKAGLHKQIFQLTQELDSLRLAEKNLIATVDDLNSQLDQSEAKHLTLSASPESEGDEGAESLIQMQSIYNATHTKLSSLEQRIEEVAQENQSLRQQINSLQVQGVRIPATPDVATSDTHTTEAAHPEIHPMPGLPDADIIEDEPDTIVFNQDKSILAEKIVTSDIDKDDLTLIEGIGTFLEKKLNDIGVYSYEEMSTWDSNRVAEVTRAIGHFEGRIEKDKWVEQAAQLALQKQENPDQFGKKSAEAWSDDTEDLKIVEGIGPKIEEVLQNAGIGNWELLAAAEPDEIRAILDEAGSRFRMHDPATWPAQARLALNGEWAVLKEYQDELIGGRDLG
jgi:predicted flap endonuclease-1-like 5' DNA nuclease